MNSTLKKYLIGFISSLVLTGTAFTFVETYIRSGHQAFWHPFLIAAILALAIVQCIVQLIFFLHLGSESGLRWNLVAFGSTLAIILILVIGSIWIMNHLNYNMMASPSQMNNYIQSQDGL